MLNGDVCHNKKRKGQSAGRGPEEVESRREKERHERGGEARSEEHTSELQSR